MSYTLKRDGAARKGSRVDNLLDKIEDLENATNAKDGTMSAADKTKLDSLEDDEEMTIEEMDTILTW